MRFYTPQHTYYCGIDRHAKARYVCLLDQHGTKLVHKNLPTTPEACLRVIAPSRDNLVVGVACMCTWEWLADLCAKEGLAFVLGPALSRKAIPGGKAKNDKLDAHKIALLLRGGMCPQAYVSPAEMRATRDLLRRRCHLVRQRADLLAPMQNTTSQYNLPEIGKKLAYKATRAGGEDHSLPRSQRAQDDRSRCVPHRSLRQAVGGGGTHEECLQTQPAILRRPGRGHRRVSRARHFPVPLFSAQNP